MRTLTTEQRERLARALLEDPEVVEASTGLQAGTLYSALTGQDVRAGTMRALEIFLAEWASRDDANRTT